MYVMLLGLRGFPGVQGGVENHVENLAPILCRMGCRVEVVVRSPFMPREAGSHWCGVRYIRVWAPKLKHTEAIVHSFLGVLVAAWRRPDILHIHAIGPSIVAPIARLLGLRVIVTHHGPDYDRLKWGFVARRALHFGEALGMRFSHGRIAVSRHIKTYIEERYRRSAELIPNGTSVHPAPETTATLERFGLAARKYILCVGRIVPEKRQQDLIAAFAAANLPDWKLVIVGKSDHPDAYTRYLDVLMAATPSVVGTGFQTGAALAELYANAGLFVLPSSHEGLPIALLEALGYGIPAVASAIPANLEIDLGAENYYPVGDVHELKERLLYYARVQPTPAERAQLRALVEQRYNWQSIAVRTQAYYAAICPPKERAEMRGLEFERDGLASGQAAPVKPLSGDAGATMRLSVQRYDRERS